MEGGGLGLRWPRGSCHFSSRLTTVADGFIYPIRRHYISSWSDGATVFLAVKVQVELLLLLSTSYPASPSFFSLTVSTFVLICQCVSKIRDSWKIEGGLQWKDNVENRIE